MPGKYGDLIKKAREPENQITSKPNAQQTNKPDSQQTNKPDNQITRDESEDPTIQITSKPDNQQTSKTNSQITRMELEQARGEEKEVNLCIKVPKSLRQHWAAEAKRQGTTMTAIIIEALTAKFGEPN